MRRAFVFAFAMVLGVGCGRRVEVFGAPPIPDDGGFFPPDPSIPDAGFAVVDGAVVSQAPLFDLGQALFFDRELSGNRNIACATCHVPFLQTTEAIPLSIGQGAVGLGPTRGHGENNAGTILPRNTTDLFNRVEPETRTLFWDGRLQLDDNGQIQAPVPLPSGILTLLQAQALLPLLDRDEMRGQRGDFDVFGGPNELADFDDDDPEAIWAAIVQRLRNNTLYRDMFVSAFPFEESPTIQQVAIAIAFFENTLWDTRDTRFDGFAAMTEEEALGQELFFGEAGCANCHSGDRLSDQSFHNIGVPQLGPGKDAETHLDEGRALVTHEASDRFAFRTPPLRNVRLTGPYMHNGAFATLDAAVRHHLDPEASLRAYESFSVHIPVHDDEATLDAVLATLDENVRPARQLRENEVLAIIRFLHTLDSQAELRKGSTDGVPLFVPSGLPVDVWPGGSHPSR